MNNIENDSGILTVYSNYYDTALLLDSDLKLVCMEKHKTHFDSFPTEPEFYGSLDKVRALR